MSSRGSVSPFPRSPPSFLPVWYCDTSIGYLFATHCNALRRTATHCNALQHAAVHCDTLRHTATHCNTLQHSATHCNTQVTVSRQRAKSLQANYTSAGASIADITATVTDPPATVECQPATVADVPVTFQMPAARPPPMVKNPHQSARY